MTDVAPDDPKPEVPHTVVEEEILQTLRVIATLLENLPDYASLLRKTRRTYNVCLAFLAAFILLVATVGWRNEQSRRQTTNGARCAIRQTVAQIVDLTIGIDTRDGRRIVTRITESLPADCPPFQPGG